MTSFSESERHLLSLFSSGSSFSFEGDQYEVCFSGKPTAPRGEPKTDIFVRCIKCGNGTPVDFKISYKKENADFLENKISQERAESIFGCNWSNIIRRSTMRLRNEFNGRSLVFKTPYRKTEAGSITLGWKFEILAGKPAGDLSGIIPLTMAQKKDILSGNSLPLDKRNALVNGDSIVNSGIADYIIVRSNVNTIQEAADSLLRINDEYVRQNNIDMCFACKALNYRSLNDPQKWDGDRPLAVQVFWTAKEGVLTPRIAFNRPLVVRGNEVGEQLKNAMARLGIRTTNDITERNCVSSVIFEQRN